jgi:hypothetical protein
LFFTAFVRDDLIQLFVISFCPAFIGDCRYYFISIR